MSLTEEQKALRRTGIGGSEIASIMGVNPFAGPLDVWLAKVEGYEKEDNEAMERGRFLEDGIARWYAHRTASGLTMPDTMRHATHAVALCTPDRFARRVNEGCFTDVSIKSPGPFPDPDDWGADGSDLVPVPYNLQLQQELEILRSHGFDQAEFGELAAMVRGGLRIYRIVRDDNLVGELLEASDRFWRDYVVTKTPPDIDGSEGWSEYLKRKFGSAGGPIIEATARDEVLALKLMEAEQRADTSEAEYGRLQNEVKARIGGAGVVGIRGAFGSITWKPDKNGQRSFRVRWKR